MRRPVESIEQTLWSYLRGVLDEAEFEAWVYAEPALEARLGEDDYLSLISADYRDESNRARAERADLVRGIAARHFPRECFCLSLQDEDRLTWSGGTTALLGEGHLVLARRTPWIQVQRCCDCGTHWLLGTDTVDDEFLLRRLTLAEAEAATMRDVWPETPPGWERLVPDEAWLRAFGYATLGEWRTAEDPTRRTGGVTPPG